MPAKKDVVKPGYKTTEFWLSAVATLAGLVMGSGLADDHIAMKVAGFALSALLVFGYNAARAKAKSESK